MTTVPTELDADTRQRLADEVERLVRMGKERKQARRIVWDDYLDELAAYTAPVSTAGPEPPPPEIPVPEPPKAAPAAVTKPALTPREEHFFTPDRLQRNRAALAQVKQLVGIRDRRT